MAESDTTSAFHSRSHSVSVSPAVHYVESVDRFQQILFDTVLSGQHMVGMFPLAQSFLPAYAFTALSLPGLTIVVCLDPNQIQLHCDTLSLAGVVYPEVASLDGTQTPHLVRETYEAINQRQTRLLYVTPSMLSTLPFLQMMTHTTVSMVVVEEAQYLLPIHHQAGMLSLVESLHRLSKVPPLCLLSSPLPAEAPAYLSALFPTRAMAFYHVEMTMAYSRCVVHKVLNQKQKFSRLQHILVDPPEVGDNPVMPTLIVTPDESSTFQAVTGLDQLGVEPVYIYPSESEHHDNRTLREVFRRGGDAVLVSDMVTGRFLVPPTDVPFRLVYWQLPDSMAALYGWLATACPPMVHKEQMLPVLPRVTVEIFYAKEDYTHRLDQLNKQPLRIQASGGKRPSLSQSLLESRREYQQTALQAVRQFCLSTTCRLIDVAEASGMAVCFNDQYTCGVCDVCRPSQSPLNVGFLMKGLQHLLY